MQTAGSDIAPHIVISGGGTGGHLFPGLAVGQRLRERLPGAQITFALSGRDWERRQVSAAGFEQVSLKCRPSRASALRSLACAASQLGAIKVAARWLAAHKNVRVVVGLGGYASVPMAAAARLRGIPLLLLEQNVIPGRATRWLSRVADDVCLAFDAAREALPASARTVVTGTPLRASFAQQPVPYSARQRRLIVLGGSQGADDLNRLVPAALAALGGAARSWHVLHQCGGSRCQETQRRYQSLGIRAEVVEFVDQIANELAGAQLAVCRAGGTTLAELAATAVPSVLLPYPFARDDHQRLNARQFLVAGAARLMVRADAPAAAQQLTGVLEEVVMDDTLRGQMSSSMARLARHDATDHVVSLLARHCGYSYQTDDAPSPRRLAA